MTRTTVFRPWLIIILGWFCALLIGNVSAQGGWTPRPVTANLKGSGATFPAPLYAAWIQTYKKINPTVTISYQPVGSGQGQKDFINYLTDFGGSDAALTASRVQSEAPDALHIPTVLGAVVPTYHLPGVAALRFSPETLAGIYLGAIKKWNDPRITADNPGVTLPTTSITVVYRSDGSGTTSIWTDYLSKISADWKKQVGSGNSVRWPVGVGAPGNAGVASTVKNTKGGIGYVELVFALANKLPVPAVKNAAGTYITPSLESASAAAEGITIPANLVVSLTNSANPKAYPVVGFTYLLVHSTAYTDVAKAQALTDFIYWSLTEGTGAATRLGYAPLPAEMRAKAIAQLAKVTVGGEHVFTAPTR